MLKVGDKAPAFSLKNADGKTVKLSDFKGKTVALYFYPKDNTPGCSKQACSLRDGRDALKRGKVVVLGVSPDGEASHRKFAGKFELPFDLLCDTQLETAKRYGVYGLKKFMGREYMGVLRTTFLIDGKGVVRTVLSKPNTADHANEILAAIK